MPYLVCQVPDLGLTGAIRFTLLKRHTNATKLAQNLTGTLHHPRRIMTVDKPVRWVAAEK